ncbi:DUF305 domain-containing protein [Ornithinimicrobium faecis]|uniref:DUF305 domain-containing protein n=1 Tax=Ornithinimicrobium faecis TaxID=2934158 RepID=UPI002117C04B|nr:DUF305 domain-containing protein [Ornithinimicrobium sp. HY1745]
MGATADDETPEPSARQSSRFGGVGIGLITGVAVIGLILGTQLGWLVFGNSTPGDESVAAGFARDMGEHHAQAVEMSLEVLQTTEDEGVRALATDIASTQGNQQGQMEGWIRTWGLPMARPGDRMDWMDPVDHSMHMVEGAPMAGMANPEQMESLRAADGEAADVLYLQLMTTHHIAGVEMAEAAVDLGVDGEVKRLAAAMVNGQESEIDLMLGMLEERGEQSQEQSGMTVGVAEQGEPMDHDDMGHGEDDPADDTGGHHH